LFLKKPTDSQAQSLVQKIFQSATSQNDNPDVRDRAYVYWRLLSSNPQIAQNVVLSDKPPITTTIQSLPPALLDQLINELSTLASVYHKPPETFVGHGKYGADAVQKAAIE
jgi:vesicle coat complex subunit